jgi:predicted RNase H-like HicB family nuclease
MRYAIVIEKSANGFGAYVPDLPGCVAMGDTVDETEGLISEAIGLHLAAMREEGQQIPEPSTLCDYVEVQA